MARTKEQHRVRTARYRAKNLERVRQAERVRAAKRWADPKEHHKRRAWYWKRTYNITAEFVADLYTLQNGGCAICLRPLNFGKHLHIDHNHATKEVRGILCRACNQAEGHIRDASITPEEFATRLSKYLANPPSKIVGLV